MIRIAICDDNKSITEGLYQYLVEKAKQFVGEELRISIYYSGSEFLHDVKQGFVFHIVFLDIQMDGMNGVEVGQILRDTPDGDGVIIIYMSSHDSYYEGISRIGVFRFIKKPINIAALDDAFSRAMTQAIKNRVSKPKVFQYKINTEVHSIKLSQIVYLKNIQKFIEIYTWNEATEGAALLDRFYASLDETMKQLSKESFVQCARSIIVNLDYVQRMRNDGFILMDREATEISIGKAYKEMAKDAYFRCRGRLLQ